MDALPVSEDWKRSPAEAGSFFAAIVLAHQLKLVADGESAEAD